MMLSSSCIYLFSYLLLMSAAYLLQLLRQHLVFVSQLLQLIRLTVGDKHKKGLTDFITLLAVSLFLLQYH